MQILLTRACTLACYGCTQGSNLSGKPTFMPLEMFEQAVMSLKTYPWLVALFGGQPTLHPKFPEICSILASHVPIERRGLWTNALNGHGDVCRKTFLPHNCNLNLHLSKNAHEEFAKDWPEAKPFGLAEDCRHSPPFAAIQDLVPDEGERWEKIAACPINRHWSAILIQFRGQLRGFFCELAGAQAHLHEDELDYPDLGCRVVDAASNVDVKWWQHSMTYYAEQVRYHCHACGVPLQGYGELSQAPNGKEQVTVTHANVYKPKRAGREVELVTSLEQLGVDRLTNMTRYMENAKV